MKVTVEKVIKDYQKAKSINTRWTKEAREDLKMALGQQWTEEQKSKLKGSGRPAFTFNIIQALIFLVSGYERQQRSSIRAYPEGGEDSLTSEILTRLIKQVSKNCHLDMTQSQQFEEGVFTGKGFVEPYIDYTYDLINGRLNFDNNDPTTIKIDPRSVKYDLSDAKFVVKRTLQTKEDLEDMFPNKKKALNNISPYKPGDDDVPQETDDSDEVLGEGEDYPNVDTMEGTTKGEYKEDEYALYEYYYKKYVEMFLAIDPNDNFVELFETKKEAQEAIKVKQEKRKLLSQQANQPMKEEPTEVISRKIPKIMLWRQVGNEKMDDDISPFWPKWRNYPFIPCYAHYTPLAKKMLKREDLAYQGIVRSLKDPQKEKNKRRSQAIHIVNSIANGGWLVEEDTWTNPDRRKKFGSTPGVDLEYKKGKQRPTRIEPARAPQGHILFEKEAEEDIKMISGLNADLLAMADDKNASGRAIALRQQQGILMIRRIFDNFLFTKEITGRFILSQLGELFTPQKALQVLGSDFIINNFGQDIPQAEVPNPKMEKVKTDLAYSQALKKVGKILDDDSLQQFDIAIGEGQESPTVRYGHYAQMLEMAEKGLPVPPNALIEYSDLPETVKKQILEFMQEKENEQPNENEQPKENEQPNTKREQQNPNAEGKSAK